MRALILAAGRGKRMGALTDDRPKGLVELGGQSLIERAVASLKAGGCDEVGVVTGYRAELVAPFGARAFHNPRWAETNMVMSLSAADAWLRESPVIVSYSDIFYAAETVRALIACEAGLAVSYDPDWRTLWAARFADPLSDAESFRLNGASQVVDIGRKMGSLSEIEGQYMGLVKITPPAWRTIAALIDATPPGERDRLDMTSLLARLISAGVAVHAVRAEGVWGECDSESDLRLYERWMRQGRLQTPASDRARAQPPQS